MSSEKEKEFRSSYSYIAPASSLETGRNDMGKMGPSCILKIWCATSCGWLVHGALHAFRYPARAHPSMSSSIRMYVHL